MVLKAMYCTKELNRVYSYVVTYVASLTPDVLELLQVVFRFQAPARHDKQTAWHHI